MMTRRLRMGALLTVLLMLAVAPAALAAEPQYFPETQHNLLDPMGGYWQAHGGLPVFGYPISEAFAETNQDTSGTYQTQYFERNRLEAHPENAAPYDILLGLLGKEVLAQQGRDWTTFPKADPGAAHFFAATGHAVTHTPFWEYFRAHGLEFDGQPGYSEAESIALFGLPLSEATMETNSSGDTVLTQWFERARFEWHPNNPAEYQVLLGLLGKEATMSRSSESPFQPTVAQDEAHAAAMQLYAIFNERRQAEYGKPPVAYRADVQAEADAIARDIYDAHTNGGNPQQFLTNSPERLAKYGNMKAVYAQFDAPIVAQCKGVDPVKPIASAYSPVVANYDFSTLTLGVSTVHNGSCGKSITIVYVLGY